MATECYAMVRGSAVRVTGLRHKGSIPDVIQYAVSKSVAKVTINEVTESGSDELLSSDDTDNDNRLRFVRPEQTLHYTVDIDFLRVDPGVLSLITGIPLIYKDLAPEPGFSAIGFSTAGYGDGPFGGVFAGLDLGFGADVFGEDAFGDVGAGADDLGFGADVFGEDPFSGDSSGADGFGGDVFGEDSFGGVGASGIDGFGGDSFGEDAFGGGATGGGDPGVPDVDTAVVGFDSDTRRPPVSFALEVWSKLAGSACVGGTKQYGYTVLPFLKGGHLTGFEFQNGLVSFNIRGAQTRRGSRWEVGPYDLEGSHERLVDPVSRNTLFRQTLTTAAPPTEVCGVQETADVIEGGTATVTSDDIIDGGTAASTSAWIVEGGRAV